MSISLFARRCRRRFGFFFSSLCCFHPPARRSFPEAVRFRRLAAPRLVFIFGIACLSRSVSVVRLRAQDDVEHSPLHSGVVLRNGDVLRRLRSEEHTSELQSHSDLVCRLLLEKKKNINRRERSD